MIEPRRRRGRREIAEGRHWGCEWMNRQDAKFAKEWMVEVVDAVRQTRCGGSRRKIMEDNETSEMDERKRPWKATVPGSAKIGEGL